MEVILIGLFYFSRFVCIDPFWCRFPVSSDKNVLFLVQRGYLSHGKFYYPLLSRKREIRDPFVGLPCWSSGGVCFHCRGHSFNP